MAEANAPPTTLIVWLRMYNTSTICLNMLTNQTDISNEFIIIKIPEDVKKETVESCSEIPQMKGKTATLSTKGLIMVPR